MSARIPYVIITGLLVALAFFVGQRSQGVAPSVSTAPPSPAPPAANVVFQSGGGIDPETLKQAVAAAVHDELRARDQAEPSTAPSPPLPPRAIAAVSRGKEIVAGARRSGHLRAQDIEALRGALREMDVASAGEVMSELYPAINNDEIRVEGRLELL